MKEVTCYETSDGKICRTKEEAKRHENDVTLYKQLSEMLRNDHVFAESEQENVREWIIANRSQLLFLLVETANEDQQHLIRRAESKRK